MTLLLQSSDIIASKLVTQTSKTRRVGKFRVCSSFADVHVRVRDSLQTMKLHTSTSKQQHKQGSDGDDNPNYYVNTGDAIRTLRDQLPAIFYTHLTYDIYRDDIVFKDPLNTFVGIDNYKLIFWALRFNGKIFFKALWVDVISIWQPVENVIMIRWTVHGIPRVPWESRGRFDGTSEYKLDKNGKIFEHRVDNVVVNSPPKFRVLAVEEMIQSLGCPSTPKPTCFEILSSPVMMYAPYLVRFTWMRYYLAFNFTLAWRCAAKA
eukprot:TRINITY_DN7874_c0_g1_i1.p1 TRINITY_DN7874_c0_g1~~TRINITY_DN7874_c0_g1_i1.p1  ORF type:complete len:263 (+),score=30.99 TRINITY_DN7874_c0_g1_i1:140-928(+)